MARFEWIRNLLVCTAAVLTFTPVAAHALGRIPAADLLPRDARQVFADPALWAPFVVVGQ